MNWLTKLSQELLSFLKDVAVHTFTKKPAPEIPKPIPAPVPDPVVEPRKPMPILPRQRLYLVAASSLGTDASPNDLAPDEYGCAETVNEIYKKTFGEHIINPGISTYQLYRAMLNQKNRFMKVWSPMPGDIIISPTGYGNGAIPNGHVGYCMANDMIASNNSFTGKFEINYSISSWKERYVIKGGYPFAVFRAL